MSFHGIAPLDPAGKSLVENFHVAITLFVENAVSQTGQVTRARSVKNHQFVFRDNGKLQGDLIQRNREGAFDVGGVVLLRAADIDDQGLLFLDNLIHEFVQLVAPKASTGLTWLASSNTTKSKSNVAGGMYVAIDIGLIMKTGLIV